jgi:hypothetical protein
MDGQTARTVHLCRFPSVLCLNAAWIPGTGDGPEPLPHYTERLPEQG